MQALMGCEEFAGRLRTVGLKTVPNQDYRAGQLYQQHTQEIDDPLRIDIRIGVKSKIQVDVVPGRRHAERGDHGHFLMRARALIEQRCLAAWTPRAADQRGHQHATFVNKHEPGLQVGGFF